MQKDLATTTQAPLVSVIIVTWNKKGDVIRLLEQLKEINYPGDNYDIIVVDNSSSDNTVHVIEADYPWVRLIKNPQNLGGAGGFNTGMRWVLENRSESKYMWLLDNDVMVDGNALKELVAVMESSPEAAMCGSKVMNIAKPSEIIEAGAFLDFVSGKTRSHRPRNDADSVHQVDYVAACSLLVRTESVRQIGMLQEDLFIYWDDMEWGARFNASGQKVLACCASVVYHPSWGERTADNSAEWRNYYRTRNRLWFFSNYTTGAKRRLLLARIALYSTMFALANCIGCDLKVSHAIIRGIEDFLRDAYGKRDFHLPVFGLKEYLSDRMIGSICVFLRSVQPDGREESLVRDLKKRLSGLEVFSIVPNEVRHTWEDLCGNNNVLSYRRLRGLQLSWTDKLRVFKFLWAKPWKLLVTSPPSYWMGGIRGREVAIVDFDKGLAISIEKLRLKDLLSTSFVAMSLLTRVLLFPPATERLGLSPGGP
ncbi:MAG: glycosyltransferase family 2 protein [Thermodesulfobacteriota bacterium]|nr:glycosyltransferase family 2 protein [Thermodesulfobacteriota bacterium]